MVRTLAKRVSGIVHAHFSPLTASCTQSLDVTSVHCICECIGCKSLNLTRICDAFRDVYRMAMVTSILSNTRNLCCAIVSLEVMEIHNSPYRVPQ